MNRFPVPAIYCPNESVFRIVLPVPPLFKAVQRSDDRCSRIVLIPQRSMYSDTRAVPALELFLFGDAFSAVFHFTISCTKSTLSVSNF